MGEVDTSKLAFEPNHTGQGLVLHLLQNQMYPLTPVYIYSDPVNGRSGYKQTCFEPNHTGQGLVLHLLPNQMYPLTPVYIYSDPVNGRSGYKQTCF